MNHDVEPVAQWLIGGARPAVRPQGVLGKLCDRAVACGISLWRVAVFVRPLHPNVARRHFEWRLGEEVTVSEMPYQALDEATFAGSPVPLVCRTGLAIRCHLGMVLHASDCPSLESFRTEGVTDYWVTPLLFSNIWLSGMRGFTPLADRLPPAQLVALLNRYFDWQIPAVTRYGGETLKFIGDGLLAIFPIEGGVADTCGAALAAAEQASAAVAAIAVAPDAAAFGRRPLRNRPPSRKG